MQLIDVLINQFAGQNSRIGKATEASHQALKLVLADSMMYV
jgi:hypothetical protein